MDKIAKKLVMATVLLFVGLIAAIILQFITFMSVKIFGITITIILLLFIAFIILIKMLSEFDIDEY